MDIQYSGSLVGDDYSENSMETHAEDERSITTEERDERSPEEEQSSITTENSSEEEIDPWSTLINDAASKVQDQYDDILQALLMEGHDESEAKEEAFAQILPVFQEELGDVYMGNVAWMKALKKDPIHKKIMDMATAVEKRKFLLHETAFRRSGTFSGTMNPNTIEPKINYCPKQTLVMRRLYLNKYVETLFLFSFICLLNHIRHNVIPISHNVIMRLSILSL